MPRRYDGQGAIAMRAGKDYAKLTGDSFYEVLTLIRFGRFDEVLRGHQPARSAKSRARLWDFAQGYAHLKQGQRRLREAVSRARAEDRRHVEGDVPRSPGEGSARRRRRHSRRRDHAHGRRSAAARSRRSRQRPSTQDGARSTTSRSRCRSRRATGWAPRCSRRSGSPSRSRSIAPSSSIIRTTAGRCSDCSRRSRARARSRPRSTPIFAASWSRSDTWIRSSRF